MTTEQSKVLYINAYRRSNASAYSESIWALASIPVEAKEALECENFHTDLEPVLVVADEVTVETIKGQLRNMFGPDVEICVQRNLAESHVSVSSESVEQDDWDE